MFFDASSNATGSSLKDCLYPAPSLCESFFDVLHDFYRNNIDLICDMEKVLH